MSTSKSLPAFIAVGLAVLGASRTSAADHRLVHFALAADAVGQTGKAKTANDRQEVEGLLVEARKAIKESKYDAADALITRAERMNVEFSLFHLGDTPKKLRGELNAAKRSKRRETIERPSQQFSAELPNQKPVETPLAKEKSRPAIPEVPQEIRDPDQEQPLALPTSEGMSKESPAVGPTLASPEEERNVATRVPAPVREHPVVRENNPEVRRQSDAQLLAARRALADGDVRRASQSIEEARKLNVAYGFHDDTPDRVDAALRNYQQAMQTRSVQDSEAVRHQLADLLMDQAQQLMRWREYDDAERVVRNAKNLRVNYGPFEPKPDAMLEKISAARQFAAGGAAPQPLPATAAVATQPPTATPADATPASPYPITQAVFEARNEAPRNLATSAREEQTAGDGAEALPGQAERLPAPEQEPRQIPENITPALQLFRDGEQALKDRDVPKALEYFRQAYAVRDQLDRPTARRLQDHLQMLSAPSAGARGGAAKSESLIDSAGSKQQLLEKQVAAEIGQRQTSATKIREKEPKRAMEILKEARASVEASGAGPDARAVLLRRVDRSIADLEKYILDNRAQIELDAANKEVIKEVERSQQAKIEVDGKLANLIEEFNQLMDEERYPEAEVLAKRARELDPDNPVVKQIVWHSKLTSRTQRNKNLIDDKENAAWQAFDSVEHSAIPFDDREPYLMPAAKKWKDLTKSRSKRLAESRSRRSESELEIDRKMKTPVSLKFRNRPLSEVLDQLQKLTAVNMHLDPKGLDEEGVTSDTPVTIDLTQDISLKSALNLILEPLHLSYVIKDEVLKITSEQLRDGEVFTHTYDVADLVIPIPNFSPNGRMGLAGALGDAYGMAGNGISGMGGGPGTAFVASHDGTNASGIIDPKVLAQMNQLMPGGAGSRNSPGNQGAPFGPGGLGGGSQANFDTLIDLIVNTVKPQTWDEVGGPGSIQPFQNNLSLVISQTQDVHEEIVDLLEQLRRNQDLQVTVEVRFITLNDNFFEQIGVDLQLDVVNNAPRNPLLPGNKREIVGLQGPGGNNPAQATNYTSNFDIPFTQNSFTLAAPQFGQPAQVASFGLAILSDLEAFLLVNASQGDRRSNVLQAPKVTMFNGQQASVIDSVQQPFVISVIPVVGDFAAAYQPVITVLSQGTALTVQAVISNDRRFVRLTVVPFFSQIGDVQEFTFSGSKTTTNNTAATSANQGDTTSASNDATTSTDGVTIQLPQFAIVSVSTTVSVPDGGTVLLGGIKRLSEGRNEFGVPILSKLPYINRLFKNVGIGRETQSLMMMVTPRIIIQEEEEERLGIQAPP